MTTQARPSGHTSPTRTAIQYAFRGLWSGAFAGFSLSAMLVLGVFVWGIVQQRSGALFGIELTADSAGGVRMAVDLRLLILATTLAALIGAAAGVLIAARRRPPE